MALCLRKRVELNDNLLSGVSPLIANTEVKKKNGAVIWITPQLLIHPRVSFQSLEMLPGALHT